MNADLLVRQFERLGNTQEAVPRLRKFIVSLAVAGRLSRQQASDEPVHNVLLGRSSMTKAPGMPSNWVRRPLGELIELRYGKGLPVTRRADVGPVAVYGSNGVVARTDEALAGEASIIVGRKGSAGALVLANGPSWTTDVAYFVIPPPYFEIRFLFLALQALHLDTLGKGVKPGLSRSDANPLLLVVPPMAEQHRIVGKVEELMALCDQLEATQEEQETRRDALQSVSLHRLTADDASRPADVRFFLDQSRRLLTKPEHVAGVRRAILDLAIRGRLVSQDPEDERQAAEYRGRTNYAPPTTVLQAEDPAARTLGTFPIPHGWIWCSLLDICESIVDGDHQPPPQADDGIPFLVIGNVRKRPIDYASSRRVPRDYYAKLDSAHRPVHGDVLYTLVGATLGEPILVTDPQPFCVQRHIGIIRPSDHVDRHYLLTTLRSGFVYDQATACATGTGQKTVPLGGLRAIRLPLPPLAEQHRIVAKVDELMRLSDELETALASAQHERWRLLGSLLREALGDSGDRAGVPALATWRDGGATDRERRGQATQQ